MNALFHNISKDIEARKVAVQSLAKTLQLIQDKPQLFDRDDIDKTEAELLKSTAELQAVEKVFADAMSLYDSNVLQLETLIYDKEKALLDIDEALGTISNNETLRHHYGFKQATLQKGVEAAKAQLCGMIKKMFEGITPLTTL